MAKPTPIRLAGNKLIIIKVLSLSLDISNITFGFLYILYVRILCSQFITIAKLIILYHFQHSFKT